MVDKLDRIKAYFPGLSVVQMDRLGQLYDLYDHWNEKINVVSRKDIENLYIKHVLHSLAIAKFIQFVPGSLILDLGTGGGFPGIPLAILFEDVTFHLVDGRGKKIKVTQEVANELGLVNIFPEHIRVEDIRDKKYDYVVSRAVASIDKLVAWCKPHIKGEMINSMPNGLICLKGGDLTEEMNTLHKSIYREVLPLSNYFQETEFEDKSLVFVELSSK